MRHWQLALKILIIVFHLRVLWLQFIEINNVISVLNNKRQCGGTTNQQAASSHSPLPVTAKAASVRVSEPSLYCL